MSELIYPEIKTHPQFVRLIQPSGNTEIENMLNELINHPDTRKIRVWHGNHLNDQERFECCKDLNIPVEIEELFFEDMLSAAIYICSIELQKSTLTGEYKKYLIGQYYRYKVAHGEKSSNRGLKYVTAGEIAHELFISAGTVMKYGIYAEAMNVVFDQSIELGQKILLNKIKISHENVIELSHLKPEEIRVIAESAERDKVDHLSLSYIRSEVKWSYFQTKAPVSRREKKEKKLSHRPAIHQMPVYDPDSEVNSLCMTIDSWISSIQRVSTSENFEKITLKASLQLMKKLSFLEHTINAVQESLVERTNE